MALSIAFKRNTVFQVKKNILKIGSLKSNVSTSYVGICSYNLAACIKGRRSKRSIMGK